jgi:hypothetical protein
MEPATTTVSQSRVRIADEDFIHPAYTNLSTPRPGGQVAVRLSLVSAHSRTR